LIHNREELDLSIMGFDHNYYDIVTNHGTEEPDLSKLEPIKRSMEKIN